MGSFVLVLVVVLVLAALVMGVVTLLYGDDPGLAPAEPDGRSRPLPTDRPLSETDMEAVRFDTAVRGYRMEQVDRALRRTAYDVGYKEEMITVLEAEVAALRDGRTEDAELLRKARESARQAAARPESDDAELRDAQADEADATAEADEATEPAEVAAAEPTAAEPAASEATTDTRVDSRA